MTDCYHCGGVIRSGHKVVREIDGVSHSMCCEGCATVAAIVHESGLEAYYKKRTALPPPVDESNETLPQTFSELLDDEAIHQHYVDSNGEQSTTAFIVHNIHCPTCVWLIESHLASQPGIVDVKLNYRTQKLKVSWRSSEITLSEIVSRTQSLGYGLVPYSSTAISEMVNAQHQDLLKRMGVAGIFGMQIMVIAVALYSSAWTSIQVEYEELFRRLSLLFVLPVLFYSAAPILGGAWRDLKQRTATMDVPIALGLIIAFFASLTATLSGSGEIYYDSIAMFVFIQLIARFLEKGAYRRMTDRITNLSASTPNHANRLVNPDQVRSTVVVPALRLVVGDFVLIKPGEAIPADGEIISGSTDVDEALLTGESSVVQRTIGDSVFGGSINVSSTIVVRVTRPSAESALASITKLLEDSMSGKPSNTRLSDEIAGYFSVTVVMIALCVGVFWYWSGDSNWLSYPIAVLVVACPCALALAVPTALTAAVNSAANLNILIAHPDAVQTLAKANTFLFDKTGTLTQSQAHLTKIDIFGELSRSEAHEVATLLSSFSDHPICRALSGSLESDGSEVAEVEIEHGGGIAGCISGKRYYLGSRSYVYSKIPGAIDKISEPSDQVGLIAYLSDDTGVLAKFLFDNPLRDDALHLIGRIMELPARLALVTGDRQFEAERVAGELNIAGVHWGCSPKGKLDIIRSHQQLGECVAMVGDGINDTPTLAIANVSIAPARAQHIAKANADVLLLDDRLDLLVIARSLAEFTVKVMRNNTVWAIAYNLIGISLAAAGFVPPLAAAIGMSVSSILVVGNSLRITAYEHSNT